MRGRRSTGETREGCPLAPGPQGPHSSVLSAAPPPVKSHTVCVCVCEEREKREKRKDKLNVFSHFRLSLSLFLFVSLSLASPLYDTKTIAAAFVKYARRAALQRTNKTKKSR